MYPESSLQIVPNWPYIEKTAVTSQFAQMTSSSIFFDVILFLLSCLVNGTGFMLISTLVLEL